MTDPDLTLTIHHQSTQHTLTLPSTATLQDLTNHLATTLHIPPETQKLLIAPKPGMQKHPFPATPLTTLPLTSPKFKITLLGTPTEEIRSLHAQSEETARRASSRAAALAAASKHKPARTPSGIHTLSSSSNNYTFHRLLPLSYLPRPERSLDFLKRLRDDPGIKAAMAKHKFSVPLLTEMNPAEHTTMESRTLGLNRNKGEVIELRLRTDAYDGYRDYRTIRKTLCHELAHCVHSEHDRDFWDLTAQIEREVERADWKHGGQRLTGQDFYVPDDWEAERGREVVDECGWTGGEFVLGGLKEDEVGRRAGAQGVEGRREVLARAAEERMRKKREEEGNESGN
ncbi:putative zinc metalloproteinase [Aspergillus alliaceus]|uniref:putative zinc metalloproteinase n=1 Tax=Petromyces alliaceus TaxID=209559 RepID=UPI0012A50148|nr:WLM domain-containing protein [Aspergillus alliaceus]KAB8232633.1 WLM domain-containing protein [Aspergillus alliaceus]